MFDRLKRLFTRAPKFTPEDEAAHEAAAEAFNTAKEASLERVLGEMEEHVIHAIIPFFLGGGLDLYPFKRHIPGTIYVTQELIHWHKDGRPKPSRKGYYELAIAFRDEAPAAADQLPASATIASRVLNPIGRYTSMKSLNSGDTAEVPGDEGEPNSCVVFDLLDLHGKSFQVADETFDIMLVIPVHPSELAFARAKGTPTLIERLKARGYYPYADLDRPPVA